MKEGILLYLTQKKTCTDEQLGRFIDLNGLAGVPLVVTGGAEGTISFYDAYKMLGEKGVDIVECFSARINDEGELELLASNITLPVGIDLLKFCRPEELGLSDEVTQNNT